MNEFNRKYPQKVYEDMQWEMQWAFNDTEDMDKVLHELI